jgi:hypothetical protein
MLEFPRAKSVTMTMRTVAMKLAVTAMLVALVEIDYLVALIVQKETMKVLRR